MKKAYIVLVKQPDATGCIKGLFTNQSKAWQFRDELIADGHLVTCENLILNEELNISLNMWVSGKFDEKINF